jgi:hypothetical protein
MNESEQKWIETNRDACTVLRQLHDMLALSSLPPRRTWVGLTEEERNHARQNVTYSQLAMTISEWADAVQIETEQRLMEKNK